MDASLISNLFSSNFVYRNNALSYISKWIAADQKCAQVLIDAGFLHSVLEYLVLTEHDKIDNMIENIIIPVIDESLKRENMINHCDATWCLRLIIAKSSIERKRAIISYGIISHLPPLISHKWACKHVLGIFCNLISTPELLLHEIVTNEEILKCLLFVIFRFILNEKRKILFDIGFHEKFRQFIDLSNSSIYNLLINDLLFIIDSNKYIEELYETPHFLKIITCQDAIVFIATECLFSERSLIQLNALVLIKYIARGNKQKQNIVNAGILPRLAELMKDQKFTAKVLQIIANFSDYFADIIQAAFDANIFPKIFNCVNFKKNDNKMKTIQCIKNIVERRSLNQIICLCNNNIEFVLLKCLPQRILHLSSADQIVTCFIEILEFLLDEREEELFDKTIANIINFGGDNNLLHVLRNTISNHRLKTAFIVIAQKYDVYI